jgi:hypothetical protein
MAFATGVAKRIALAEETTFGINPVTGGKYLRRVSSDLTLNKESYESQEILVSQQIRDARHGVRRPQGTFAGQLSPGSFNDFFQGVLRSTWTAGADMPGVSLTLDHTAKTLTGTGFTAAGIKRHDVIKLTGITTANTVLNSMNLRLSAVSDTVLTSPDIPSTTSDGALAGTVDLAVVGKKIHIPATGQLYKSYTIEHFFSDISVSEAFVGCRFGTTSIAMPATGLVTFNAQMMGQNMIQNTVQQLTTPADPGSSSALAAVNGKLTYNGTDLAIVTGLNMQITPALEAPAVIGSDYVPWIFQGRLRVTGSFTALFTDETIANTFINENEVGVSIYLTMGAMGSADFMRFTMPRVKAMSMTKSDSDMSLIQSFTFTALENVTDTATDLSTIVIQDSLA